MKYLGIILLLAVQLQVTLLTGQRLTLEPEEQNDNFIKEYKENNLIDIYNVGSEELIGIYEDITRSGEQKAIIFRKMNSDLSEISTRVEELPDRHYLRYAHQFKNGQIMALIFEDVARSKEVNLYIAPILAEKMKIDMTAMSKLASFELSGQNKRLAIRTGSLFEVVQQRGSEFIAILNSPSFKKQKITERGYVIINDRLEVHKRGNYDFGVKNKDLGIGRYTISGKGHLYCSYRTFLKDNRAGDESYILQLTSGKKIALTDRTKFLQDINMREVDESLLIFSTYCEDRMSRIKGRSQGTYLATIDEDNMSIVDESYQKYPQKVLSDYFLGNDRKAEKGDISFPLFLKYLARIEGNKYAFMMEDNTIRYVGNTQGNLRPIYGSNSAICGVIDRETSSFDWIRVIPKIESVRDINRVGCFAYLNDKRELCVLFNSTRTKERKGNIDYYINKNLKKTSLVQIRFDKNGKMSEDELMSNSERELGFIFDPDRAFQETNSRETYLVLTKRASSKLRIAKIESEKK